MSVESADIHAAYNSLCPPSRQFTFVAWSIQRLVKPWVTMEKELGAYILDHSQAEVGNDVLLLHCQYVESMWRTVKICRTDWYDLNRAAPHIYISLIIADGE